MALKIKVGGFLESRYLAIKSDHVEYFKTVVFGNKRKFKFHFLIRDSWEKTVVLV